MHAQGYSVSPVSSRRAVDIHKEGGVGRLARQIQRAASGAVGAAH